MVSRIIISPYPNFIITEETYQRDIVHQSKKSYSKHKGKPLGSFNKDSIIAGALKFEDGTNRLNFIVPVQKDDDIFLATFPDPIHLYLSQAIDLLNISEKIWKEYVIKFSMKAEDGSVYLIDSTSEETNLFYNNYLQNRVGTLMMLICSIEGFVNSLIPKNFEFRWKGKAYDKKGVQRYAPFKVNLEKVILLIYKELDKDIYDRLVKNILLIYDLRNELVHLKNYGENAMDDNYHQLFKRMLQYDLELALTDTVQYMNLLKPGFIKDRE
jgi:hypothetical protein